MEAVWSEKAILEGHDRSLDTKDWAHVEAIVQPLWKAVESITIQLAALKEQILELPVGCEHHRSFRHAPTMKAMSPHINHSQKNEMTEENKHFMMERKIQLIEEELEQIVKRVDARTQDEKIAHRRQKRSQKCLLDEVDKRLGEMHSFIEKKLGAHVWENGGKLCERVQASLVTEQNVLGMRLEETQQVLNSKLDHGLLSWKMQIDSKVQFGIESVISVIEKMKQANQESMNANIERLRAYVHGDLMQTSVSAIVEKRLQAKERKLMSLVRAASNRADKGEALLEQWGEQMVLYATKLSKMEQAIFSQDRQFL